MSNETKKLCERLRMVNSNASNEAADAIERLERELAATVKAKQENDERFMLERDEARRDRDQLAVALGNARKTLIARQDEYQRTVRDFAVEAIDAVLVKIGEPQ